ncbi:MAG: alkaline phosphatase family protein [bacterium]
MSSYCRRVVVVVLDGLRPDAIDAFDLTHLQALERMGTHTRRATTVAPSVTAAAMGSLLTGVHPDFHGLNSDRFHIPHSHGPLYPVPAVLRDAGYTSSAFLAQPPLLFRRLGKALAVRLGVDAPHFIGQQAPEIALAARRTLGEQERGLIMFHLPDADRAGHAHGWMSSQYADAARRLDATTGLIRALALDGHRDDTLLIACADHGGGGAVANDHDSAHPLDRTIPIMLAGCGVRQDATLNDASLLDLPPTVLAALGVAVPSTYVGRVLTEAFVTMSVAA